MATWLTFILSMGYCGFAGGGTGADCNQNGVPDENDIRPGDLALQAARSFPAGEMPVSIAAGDVDGDLGIDLVTANRNSSDVSVLLNRGDASLAAQARFPAGAEPVGVVLAELNGDAHLDIAVASMGSGGGGISVLFNLGAGTYGPRVPLTGLPAPSSIAAGDIEGDGDIDLVAADAASGVVSTFENDGDGGFGDGEDHDAGEEPTSVVVADFDGDGRLDIAALTLHGSPSELDFDASILFNEGEGTFADPVHFAAAESPHSMIAADIDGDSHADLVISDPSNSPSIEHVVVLRNLGNRTFASGKSHEAGFGPAGLAAGDLDGDEATDLAVATLGGVAVLINPFPDDSMESPLLVGSRPLAVAAADLDRDGDLDLASASSLSGDVSVHRNQGGASFPTPALFEANVVEGPDSGDADLVLAGDFDGDEVLDIVTASERTSVAFIRNNGGRTLAPPESLEVIGLSAAAGDLDGDEHTDLVLVNAAGEALLVLLNFGDGTFKDPAGFAAGESLASVAAADLDGDEAADLAAADAGSSNLVVLLNDGEAAFGPASMLGVGSSPTAVAAADLDGDGDADLASADSGSNGVSVLENEAGAFEPARSYPAGEKPVSLAAGDLDGDGDLDLVTADEGSDTVSVLLNNGAGAFAPRVALTAGRAPVSAVLADVDGDADLDIVSGDSGSGGISVFRNDGFGAFEEAFRFAGARNVRHLAAADLDRDGVADIIAVNTPILRESDEVEDHVSILWNGTAAPSSLDIDRNGVPDECQSRAVSRLGTPPDPVIIDEGTKAVAFAGTIAAESIGEDLVWNGAVFKNVGHGDASVLVTAARLHADTNANGTLDAADRPIGSAAVFDPATQRVAFEGLAEPLAIGEPEAMLLVLDLAGTGAGAMRLSPAPGDAASVLVLLVAGILTALRRGQGRLGLARVTPFILLALLAVPPGCDGDGDGGPREEIVMRLEALDVDGAESGLPADTAGLPLTAWPIDP